MPKLFATFKVITPLFLGGAKLGENTATELRAAAIKSAMRFWYRAIDPDYNIPYNGDGKSPTWEEYIFGSAEHGQGLFKIKLSRQYIVPDSCKQWWHNPKVAYLGYGPINKGVRKREFIEPDSCFQLDINFRPNAKEEHIHMVERALWAFQVFGGLGARSRKGFGSIAVKNFSCEGYSSSQMKWHFNDINQLFVEIKKFYDALKPNTGLKNYTCFTQTPDNIKSKCVVIQIENNQNALDQIGGEMLSYRSYRVKPSNFQHDHDDMLKYLKTGNLKAKDIPKRVAFGLPHNYFFSSSIAAKANIDAEVDKEQKRRASPLFLHIHELGNRQQCIVATFLPAKLLPDNANVLITGSYLPKIAFFEIDGNEWLNLLNAISSDAAIHNLYNTRQKQQIADAITNNYIDETKRKEILKVLNGFIGSNWNKRKTLEKILPQIFKKVGRTVPKISLPLPDDFSAIDEFMQRLIAHHGMEVF